VSYLSNGGRDRNKIWHKGSLVDEPNFEYMHSTETACDITLEDEKFNVRNIRD